APRPEPPRRPDPPPDPDPDRPPLGGVRAVLHVAAVTIPRLAPRPDDWPMEGWGGGDSDRQPDRKALAPPPGQGVEGPPPGSLDGVVVSSGIVLVSGLGGDRKHKVFAVDARDGRHLWTFTLPGDGGGAMGVTPACSSGLAFFSGQGDDNLYAVHLWTGALRWK